MESLQISQAPSVAVDVPWGWCGSNTALAIFEWGRCGAGVQGLSRLLMLHPAALLERRAHRVDTRRANRVPFQPLFGTRVMELRQECLQAQSG